MKSLVLFVLVMFSFVIAQTIQEQHDQYLSETQNVQFLRAENIPFSMTDEEHAPEISLKIDGNKYSLLIVCCDKKIYQEGMVTLEKHPQVIAVTKFADKAFKFAMHFCIETTKAGIGFEGDYAQLFPRMGDIVLAQVGAFAYPNMKRHINTDHYAEAIKAFVMSERPLFHLIFQAPQPTTGTAEDSFDCPNCKYPLYNYVHYCYKCGSCFNAGSLTCPKCYSQSWTNGKSCSRCSYCYK